MTEPSDRSSRTDPDQPEPQVARPSLRRDLIVALALICAGALLVAINGVALLLPYVGNMPLSRAALVIFALLLVDIGLFAWLGRSIIRRKVLDPIDGLVEGADRIATGEFAARMPLAETRELAHLAQSINQMADRLISNQQLLADNIASLDETNRQLTEARDAMIHAEKMATVGRMAAGIAHEVGNPLGAIIGYLALLRRHLAHEQGELLSAAEREARRIDRIIHGLLDFSRPHEAQTQPVDVNTVVNQTVELVTTQGRMSGIDVQVRLSDKVPPVLADPYQLQQVLVNLLVNASDALGSANTKNPAIEIVSVQRRHQIRDVLPARRKSDPPGINYAHRRRLVAPQRSLPEPGAPGEQVVEIMVSDNGPGIPRDLMDKIFEPFVTTKEPGKGTGLGLAVSIRLIESIGGSLQVENSAKTGGAIFRIVLPPAVETEARIA